VALQSQLIRSFRHKGLERFFRFGDARGLQAHQLPRLERMLEALDTAATVDELNVPGWVLHALAGDRKGLWSLRVSGNWRLTFAFVDGDAEVVNLEDYH
jgi:proteic killer suppression protein